MTLECTVNLHILSWIELVFIKSLKYDIDFPMEESLNNILGIWPVAQPFICTHTGITLKMWSMYLLHLSIVILVHQKYSIMCWSSAFVLGCSLGCSLRRNVLSSLHTNSIGLKSGDSGGQTFHHFIPLLCINSWESLDLKKSNKSLNIIKYH